LTLCPPPPLPFSSPSTPGFFHALFSRFPPKKAIRISIFPCINSALANIHFFPFFVSFPSLSVCGQFPLSSAVFGILVMIRWLRMVLFLESMVLRVRQKSAFSLPRAFPSFLHASRIRPVRLCASLRTLLTVANDSPRAWFQP